MFLSNKVTTESNPAKVTPWRDTEADVQNAKQSCFPIKVLLMIDLE